MRGGPRCAVTDAERAAIRAELLGPARAGGYRAVAEHVGRSVVTIRKEAQKLIDTGEMLPRLLGRPGERRVIDCPICGRELGLPLHQPHTRMTAQEIVACSTYAGDWRATEDDRASSGRWPDKDLHCWRW